MAESSEQTVIAADTKIKGEMTFDKSARILGQFEGKINAKGKLHVADSGRCNAEVVAENLQVDGAIQGDVKISQLIQLNAKSRVAGDIVADKLVASEGASIFGHVAVGDAAKAVKPSSAGASSATKSVDPPKQDQPPRK